MRNKVTYAMTHCASIDTDGAAQNMEQTWAGDDEEEGAAHQDGGGE